MPGYRVESLQVFPVCVDRSPKAFVPPQRVNPFTQEVRLRMAMSSQVNMAEVAQVLSKVSLDAPTLEEASEMAQRMCETTLQGLRVKEDGLHVVLHIDPSAYVPIGSHRHESSCWACLAKDEDPSDVQPWCFPLDQSDEERYDAYVIVRLSVVSEEVLP